MNMTARTHRILTILTIVLTQLATVTTAVVSLLVGAHLTSALTASLVVQIVGDVCTAGITIIREIEDPTATPAVLPAPTTPPPTIGGQP